MTNLEKLDNILLSNFAVKDFYQAYNNDTNFSSWLDSLIPEVKACENQKQDTPWHKYNVLGHILHSVEEMNKQTTNLPKNTQKLLAYTMFLHDIGKPACYIRRKKGNIWVDSFFGHNVESAKVTRRIAHDLGFNDTDANILEKLVYKHDIFMFIKDFPTDNPHWRTLSPQVIIDEIEDLNTVGDGKMLMKYLIMVGRSDSLAQNEKMTAESLNLLDKMDSML